MSTAAATAIDRSQNNVSDLLDVLYEILASGLEPDDATVSSAEIETFLHQHARAPKSRDEMEAFFKQGGLPLALESFARDSGLRLAAVSPATVSSGGGDLSAPESNTGRHVVTNSSIAPRPAPVVAPVAPVIVQAPSNRRLWAAISVVCVALLGVCVLGGLSLMNMRDQLQESQQSERQLLSAIEALRARTEQVDGRLSDQTKVIDSTHQDLTRLVQSFLPAEAPAQ